MDFAEKLKQVKGRVEEAAVEHEDKLRQAVDNAEALADRKSGGKYSEQIRNAGAKADGLVDKLTAAKKTAD